jgi:hypothetical protein
MPYVSWNKDDYPRSAWAAFVAFVVNWIVLWLIFFLAKPSLVGPMFGWVGGLALIFGIVNSVIAGLTLGYDGGATWRTTIGHIFTVLLLFGVVWNGCAGCEAIRADEYRNLAKITDRNWNDDVSPISPEHIRVVTLSQARWKADKVIGGEGSLGSLYEVREGYLQSVDGELWYVFPLAMRSWLQWKSEHHTPGYIMVDAENPEVDAVLKKGYRLKYDPSACHGEQLHRYLYQHGWAAKGLTDFTFELEDSTGKPYWTITVWHPSIGYSGPVVDGILVFDPTNGDSKFYSCDSAPKWIDRIYPRQVVVQYLCWWGSLIHGWANANFFGSSKDVQMPTPLGSVSHNVSLVYDNDGNCSWFTGMTSVSDKDNALTSMMLVDSRTGQIRRYQMGGINEDAALQAANGMVSNYGGDYSGEDPVPYNIYGEPTWVISISDKNHIFRRIVLIRINNAQHTAMGNNLAEALQQYRNILAVKGFSTTPEIGSDFAETTFNVTRMGVDASSGKTYYYVYTSQIPDRIFVLTSEISKEVPLTREGDRITISYQETGDEIVYVQGFNNLGISLRKTEAQARVETRRAQIDTQQVNRREELDVRRRLANPDSNDLRDYQEFLRQRKQKK